MPTLAPIPTCVRGPETLVLPVPLLHCCFTRTGLARFSTAHCYRVHSQTRPTNPGHMFINVRRSNRMTSQTELDRGVLAVPTRLRDRQALRAQRAQPGLIHAFEKRRRPCK